MYDFIRRLFLIASIILKLNFGISDYISSQKATKYSNPSIQHYMQSVSQVNNALCLATDRQALVTFENSEENIHNYWLHKSAIHAYKTSKFHAYENFTDLPAAILKEYETVSEALVGRILDETDSMDVMTLEGNETAALGNTSVDVIVRKYFYFKSKYYQDINKWYVRVVTRVQILSKCYRNFVKTALLIIYWPFLLNINYLAFQVLRHCLQYAQILQGQAQVRTRPLPPSQHRRYLSHPGCRARH